MPDPVEFLRFRVRLDVLLGGSDPGEVLAHAPLLKRPPLVGHRIDLEGAAAGEGERRVVVDLEDESRAAIAGWMVVHDRIGQTTGLTYDRHGPIAQGDHLAQPTGLEPRWHQKHV